MVALTLGRIKIQATDGFHAVFTDASGLKKGVDVRAAGVTVGSVDAVDLHDDGTVVVTFDVPREVPLTTTTVARIRWANLTGDRYLDLSDIPADPSTSPRDKPGTLLAPGATIPASRTRSALDLDSVFNGFKPLLQALSPSEVNQLSSSIIAVAQGEGGAIGQMLASVGSFTQALGDRDQLIGSVVTNLSALLATVDNRKSEFALTITRLSQLMTGLARDRTRIGTSLASLNTVAEATAGYLEQVRPELAGSVAEINKVATLINNDGPFVSDQLKAAPQVIRRLGLGGAYGSFFNFHVCGVRVKLTGPTGPIFTPWNISSEPRCSY
jgi:phospholipid/cholesterol/gamma-HCH transport system substrate-binding protein